MTIKLHITDRDGFSLGYVTPRLGMVTRSGAITRVSEKSIWTAGQYGDRCHRAYDGRLPSVSKSAVRKSDVVA